MLLEKFALPKFESRIIEEINSSRDFYNRIDILEGRVNDKFQKKKAIINNNVFDMFVGIFDLGYDLKLRYSYSDEDKDSIYVDINNKTFDEVFYSIYIQCFCKYLSKLHTLKNNRVDPEIYKLSRIAILNNDSNIVKKLANNTYLEMVSNIEVETKIKREEISQQELDSLSEKEKIRIKKLLEKIEKLDINSRLSYKDVRRVFSCFASSIFDKLTCKQKAHLANLLYNYFTINNRCDNSKRYAKTFNKNITNKMCLEIVINELLVSGRTMMVKKKNIDMVNNVLSGLPYTYKNETDKSKLTSLDDLNCIIDKIKK